MLSESVLAVQKKTSTFGIQKQNRPIGIKIPVDGIFFTGDKINTRAHHRDEKPERDLTYRLTCLLIYHGTTTHL